MKHLPGSPRKTIILLGATGSGKSLISSILTKLPKSVVLDENYLPPYLAHLKGFLGDDKDIYKFSTGLRSHINNVLSYGHNGRLSISLQCIQGKISLTEWLSSLHKKTRTIDTVILESHFFSLVPNVLLDAYPDAKFILLVREGRDVADWLEREFKALSDEDLVRSDSSEFFFTRTFNGYTVPWWVKHSDEKFFLKLSPFLRCVYFWNVLNERLWTFQMSMSESNFLVLKYEFMVQNAMKTRELLINFLDINGDLLKPRLFNKFNLTHISQASRSRLPTELLLAEEIAHTMLTSYDYL